MLPAGGPKAKIYGDGVYVNARARGMEAREERGGRTGTISFPSPGTEREGGKLENDLIESNGQPLPKMVQGRRHVASPSLLRF